MSNERIDLTQFENISSEGWEYLSDESRNINDAALDKIPDLIAELKRMYQREDELMDILTILEDRQGVEIPCSHNWITEDEYYTYQGAEWILRNVHCEYCLEDNLELGFDQTVEDFQKASE